ncbi:hypothetical protein BKA80DRAFT_309877 [Phyllosticta citrichinensis]
MSAKLLLFPALLVLLLATLARTASLADFTPRVTGLTGKCLITYRKSISGCSGDDFQTAANCSARCIAGLADIAAQVARDCNDADVDNDSIIAIFLAGQGPSTLCSNAASATAAPTTSSQNIRTWNHHDFVNFHAHLRHHYIRYCRFDCWRERASSNNNNNNDDVDCSSDNRHIIAE